MTGETGREGQRFNHTTLGCIADHGVRVAGEETPEPLAADEACRVGDR